MSNSVPRACHQTRMARVPEPSTHWTGVQSGPIPQAGEKPGWRDLHRAMVHGHSTVGCR